MDFNPDQFCTVVHRVPFAFVNKKGERSQYKAGVSVGMDQRGLA